MEEQRKVTMLAGTKPGTCQEVLPWFPNGAAQLHRTELPNVAEAIWPLPRVRILWVTGQGSETFKTLRKYYTGVKINHAPKRYAEWKSE